MISDIIYSFIIGDSFGLSILDNNDNSIKLKKNKTLNIEKGYFSFFTTNLLATIDSISNLNKIDSKDIMNKLALSLIVGKYTNNKVVIKPDNETLKIIDNYRIKNKLNYNFNKDNNNANAISRVLPIVIYNYYKENNINNFLEVESITTNSDLVLLGCYIYYECLFNLINGYDKRKALKITIPKYFKNSDKNIYKDILKGDINYKDIKFDDNIVNVLKIVFYIIFNSDNMNDILLMSSNLSGNTNIYCSLIFPLAYMLYGFDNLLFLKGDLKNKKEINSYIKNFERIFK